MKIFLVLIAFSPLINARDIHVGKDAASIHAAIKAAQPGDTIHLEPKIYRDYAGFYGKKGELGNRSHSMDTGRHWKVVTRLM
jgi:hypothetical protein